MRLQAGTHVYEWRDDWAKYPDTPARRDGWAHPGVAVNGAQEILTVHPGEPTVLVFGQDGAFRRSIRTELIEGHGIAVSTEGDVEFLWVADNGSKRMRQDGKVVQSGGAGGRVVKMAMDGRVVLELERPPIPVYAEGVYSPTGVAINEEARGGNGDVWVADGYGQSHVHRYSRFTKGGSYVGSIDGTEGAAGRFACPHGIWVDTRKGEPELYIADRSNRRVQVYDAEGVFKRSFGTDFLTSPSGFAVDGDLMVVAELRARLALLDRDDRLIGYLGANEAVCDEPGWPNMLDADGVPTRTNRLRPGAFNSPHGIATDRDGNIYVAEWLIGGRMTKLAKV